MKGQITYTSSVELSKRLANESLRSFENFDGWEVNLNEGFTKSNWKNLIGNRLEYELFDGGRLHSMFLNKDPVFQTKMACVYNNVQFWHKVVEANEPMIFVEHDIICESHCVNYDFDEYLILNTQDAVKGNPKIYKKSIFSPGPNNEDKVTINVNWEKYHNKINNMPQGIHYLENLKEYPLLYYKNNIWKNHLMVPGTACYMLSPKGAKKLIYAAEKFGLDQSDFIINAYNIKLQYVLPSPVRFNQTYINTSHLK